MCVDDPGREDTPSDVQTRRGVKMHPRVWRTPFGDEVAGQKLPEEQEWPELFARSEDVGLALSGGGIRASSESLGVLKALFQLGLLKKLRFISSNSGSSWLSAPFCFLPEDTSVEEFLGGPPLGQRAWTSQHSTWHMAGSWRCCSLQTQPGNSQGTSLTRVHGKTRN